MSSRKSMSKSARRSLRGAAAAEPQAPTPATSGPPPEPVASSSKFTLDMVPPVEESITYDYAPTPLAPQVLTDADKERLVHEIMGFAPFKLLYDVSEHARNLIYPAVAGVDGWARVMAGDDEETQHEIDLGSVALETLLESHVDRAFDMFTGWALRNSFKVPDGVELVLPNQAQSDYDRAKFVTTLPDGEGTLLARLTALRRQVEQARLVKHRLAVAEAAIDRKLALAAQRRAQVGFVRDNLAAADLAPLPDKTVAIVQSMNGMHQQIADLELPVLTRPVKRDADAWESGRQAYLSWAVGKALSGANLRAVEKDTRAVGSAEEVAALAKIVK